MADDDLHDFEVVAAGGRLTARRDSFARRRAGALRTLVSVALPVWVADVVTKRLAVAGLQPPHLPHQVLGETVRLTLAYNQQGVMGLPVGPYGRWILSAVSIALLGLLVHLLKTAYHPGRATALALMIGGGCGNLLDRLASSRGVVDFIDLGYGGWRFWTFNVADVAIDVGVALFAWMWWRTGRSAPPPAPPEKVAA